MTMRFGKLKVTIEYRRKVIDESAVRRVATAVPSGYNEKQEAMSSIGPIKELVLATNKFAVTRPITWDDDETEWGVQKKKYTGLYL